MFSNKQLRAMIVPLFFEQLLMMLVGLADTLVVSFCGEAAVSGVSLVNSFNTIFIYLFTALAAGGAVVVSQYLGRKDGARASESISQLLMISTLFACVMALALLASERAVLSALFGQVDADVMDACVTYLRITAYSYPALAIYNAGAALYRSVGKTRVTMYISIIANAINVVGNLLGVFVFKAGVAGVAWPTFISQVFAAAAITALCFRDKYGLRYEAKWIFKWNGKLIKSMLRIAVPNGIETGIFQFVKVALSSLVAMFGTYQIAANGIAQSFWSLAALVSVMMGPVFITVIGQCMGAGEVEQAKAYFKKLLRIALILGLGWNMAILALTPLALKCYSINDQTARLVFILVLIHNTFNALALPFADPLGKGLRATGDVKFTAIVTILTTIAVRLAFSILFAVKLNMGVIGIALAMCLDWMVRGAILYVRFKRGKWTRFNVLA